MQKKTFSEEFRKIKLEYEKSSAGKLGFTCSTRTFEGCPALSLEKPSWTSGPARIFFSIWTDNDTTTNRVHYNIHAFKLRQFKGHVITSREFADEFRRHFKSVRQEWPNESTEYGPLNLMQGWIDFSTTTFERDVITLMTRFEKVSAIIDRMLEKRLVPFRRPGQLR